MFNRFYGRQMISDKFFEISSPHQNLPHVSSHVELKRSEQYGRMIVAKKKLIAGDIVAVEEPFFKSLDKSEQQSRCAHCLKTLIHSCVCEGCKILKFCSHKCLAVAWEDFHKHECEYYGDIDDDDGFFLLATRMLFKSLRICGSLEKLEECFENTDKYLTVFSREPNVEDEVFYLSCCFKLECGNIYEDFKFVDSYLSMMNSLYNCKKQRKILRKILLKILGVLNRNSFHLTLKDSTVGALFAFTSLINHSCSPNVEKIKLGNRIALVCKLPIEANEQLFLCYRKPFYSESIEKRQKSLYQQFNFLCQCEACMEEERFIIMKVFNESEEISTSDCEILLKKYRSNCAEINKNFKEYPSYRLVQASYTNRQLLDHFVKINQVY